MAVSMSRALTGCGHRVSLLACRSRRTAMPLYVDLDRCVMSRRSAMDAVLSPLDLMVWFTQNVDEMPIFRTICPSVRHIAAALWHTNVSLRGSMLMSFDMVLCPNQDLMRILTEYLPVESMVQFPWDYGMAPRHQPWEFLAGRLEAYMPIDNYTLKRYSYEIFEAIRRIQRRTRHLHFTLSTFSSLERHASSFIRALVSAGRCTWLRSPLPVEHEMQLYKSDVVISPTVRTESGWFARQAMECGVPVVAFDLPPMHEFLRHEINARLVRCDLDFRWPGVPTAVPDFGSLVDEVVQLAEKQANIKKLCPPWGKISRNQHDFVTRCCSLAGRL